MFGFFKKKKEVPVVVPKREESLDQKAGSLTVALDYYQGSPGISLRREEALRIIEQCKDESKIFRSIVSVYKASGRTNSCFDGLEDQAISLANSY